MSVISIRASQYGCISCPLAQTRTHIVDGAGPVDAPLIIIGEAPGVEEDKYGIPFIGRSGKLLRAVLAANGVPDGQYFLTNTVKCRPPENRDPLPVEVGACQPWLDIELAELTGRTILVLGKTAARTLERYYPDGIPGKEIIEAYHPAYILRNTRERTAWEAVIAGAGEKALPEAVRFARHDPSTREPSQKWVRGLPDPRSPYFAADIETDDLIEDIGVRMVGWSVSDGIKAYFRFTADRGNSPEVLQPFARRAEAGRRTILHNSKYDAEPLGIPLRRLDLWECTMLMAYVLRYERVGLKLLSPEIAGLRLRAISDIIGTGHKRIPFSRAYLNNPDAATDYASEDAVATSRIAPTLMDRLAAEPALERYYREIEKPAVPILYEMEKRGILVDPDVLVEIGKELRTRIEEETAKLQALLAFTLHEPLPEKFNRGSTQQLAAAFQTAGFELTKTTKTGKPQLDKNILQSLALRYPGDASLFISELEIRSLEKFLGTYAEPLLQWADTNYRVHTHYNQAVTSTNRLSSNDPNLQNIPIRTALGKRIRRAFIARVGYQFIKADASQLEARVFAEYTRELVLCEVYLHEEHDTAGRKGSCLRCDLHQTVGDELGIPRDDAKNTFFATIYGAEEEKLATTAHIPVDRAGPFLARLRNRIPSLLTWRKRIADDLYRQGYTTTLLGWRGYFPLFASPIRSESAAALREAGNLPIQGTGAGIIKVIMAEADSIARKYEAELVETVHDELGYECPTANVLPFARELRVLARDTATRWMKLIPFVLEVAAGPNWGDCEVLPE